MPAAPAATRQCMNALIENASVNLVRSSAGRPIALAYKAASRVQAADEFRSSNERRIAPGESVTPGA